MAPPKNTAKTVKAPKGRHSKSKRRHRATGRPRGNLATLKPFKPGECGNPNGRPKTAGLVAALREHIDLPRERKAIIRRICKYRPELVLYYLEGKPVERHQIEGGERPIWVQILERTKAHVASRTS